MINHFKNALTRSHFIIETTLKIDNLFILTTQKDDIIRDTKHYAIRYFPSISTFEEL